MSIVDATPLKMKTMTNKKYTSQKRGREDLEAVSWFANLVIAETTHELERAVN